MYGFVFLFLVLIGNIIKYYINTRPGGIEDDWDDDDEDEYY